MVRLLFFFCYGLWLVSLFVLIACIFWAFFRHQPDIRGLTKSTLQKYNILLVKTIPCLDAVGWKTRLGVGFLKMNNKITRKAWRGERETRGEGKGLFTFMPCSWVQMNGSELSKRGAGENSNSGSSGVTTTKKAKR